jgi:hypothetical protein
MDDRKTPAERVIYSIAWIVGVLGFFVPSWLFFRGIAMKLATGGSGTPVP